VHPISYTQSASALYRCSQLLSRFEYIDRRTCSGMSWAGHLLSSKLSFHVRKSGPHLIRGSLGPHESTSQTASQLLQPFLHSSQHSVPMLCNGPPFPSKLPFACRSRPHLIHDSLGPSESALQTASGLVQPFLQGSRS